MAVKAAVNFVRTACQQTAFVAGKGLIEDEVHTYNIEAVPVSRDEETVGFCLTLPGKTLYLTPLLALKKFRKRGNKDGAIRSFYRLDEEGLGKVSEVTGNKGTSFQFEFTKAPLPTSKEDKIEFSKKLLKYNITLAQYENTLSQSEIKPMTGIKRTTSFNPTKSPPQSKSPWLSTSPRKLFPSSDEQF